MEKTYGAEMAYKAKQASIKMLLKEIQGKLKKDEMETKANGINWADVGSLDHIGELLNQIDEFLG